MAAQDRRWRLVCYDIRDPYRYRKVYKIVSGHGRRLQYSVFRCRLDDRATERMRWELSKVMSAEDSLLVIDLCPRCSARVVSTEFDSGWDDGAPTFLVVGPPDRTQAPAQE